MKLSIFALFISLAFCATAQNEDAKAKMNYYTAKAQNYLDKEKALSPYYTISESGIFMYASAAAKANNQPEFTLDWKNLNNFYLHCLNDKPDELLNSYQKGQLAPFAVTPPLKLKKGNPAKPLLGYKIAIDPGHIANNFEMGDLEKKHIKFQKDSAKGLIDSVEIAEGILTYATAQLLKQKLEEKGAEVMLTRKDGLTAFGKTYEQWKKEDLKKSVDSLYNIKELKPDQKKYFLSAKAKDRDIFRVVFRDLELAKRVELINNYQPTITIIIHFNVDESNLEWLTPSTKNYNMTFVGGAFMKNDLSTAEKRFEFLRLLASNHLEESIILSTAVIKSFERTLGVPTATIHDAKYLVEGCLPTSTPGVYCRNLQLPRYIHSPLVYGETLYQDNIKEVQLLNEETDKTKNKRINQVAEAYFQGILNYVTLSK